MKATLFIVFLAFCYVECRKIYKPLDKNANIDFINMEMGGYGGGNRPAAQPAAPAPVRPAPVPVQPVPAPAPVQPVPAPAPVQPVPAPAPAPKSPPPVTTYKPVVTPPTPGLAPSKPVQPQPNQIKPVPVNPSPAARPMTTPGPGTVKQLVNFYDSQGKGSPIRPYSYSQAVKQG